MTIFKNIILVIFPLTLLLLLIPLINIDDSHFILAKSSDDDKEDKDKKDKKSKKKSNDKDEGKDGDEDEDKETKKSKKNKKKVKSEKDDEQSKSKTKSKTNTESRENDNYDEFGIKKIYPTTASGQEWYLNMENPVIDDQFSPFNLNTEEEDPNFELYKNKDGSWKLKSKNSEAKVRMDVFSPDGYSPEKIETFDHSEFEKKGFMQSEKDWKNVEITGYIKLNHYSIPLDEGKFTWYNRGGHHTASNPCEGVGYKGSVYFSGDVKFSKEQWHVSYFFTDIRKGEGSIKDKWIGYKFITYNIQDVENPSDILVKMESWLDVNNDGNWIKVDDYIDSGEWGKTGKKCDGKKDQIITWGGPITTFRWDKADDVDFKNLSVREIEPPMLNTQLTQ
jgi:hypothetical protein